MAEDIEDRNHTIRLLHAGGTSLESLAQIFDLTASQVKKITYIDRHVHDPKGRSLDGYAVSREGYWIPKTPGCIVVRKPVRGDEEVRS